MKLQLNFEAHTDEDEVADGRELAANLIQFAYALLLPYGPARASELLNVVTARVVKDARESGERGTLIYFGPPEHRRAAERAHLEREVQATVGLLGTVSARN